MFEYVSDVCGFFTHVSEGGPSVFGYWRTLLLFWSEAGRFLWLDWEGDIVKNAVDNVQFLLVFLPM